MAKSALPSSKLPPLERTEALIKYYQNAYDVWNQIPGIDREMLENWLFLIDALLSHKRVLRLKPDPEEEE